MKALNKSVNIGDYDLDGIPDIMVKFDCSSVQRIITNGDNVSITISGVVNGFEFEGIGYYIL